MIFLRHHNGNGKVWGHHALIDNSSFLDRRSNLFDSADVWDSKLLNTQVKGESLVRSSFLQNCKIGSEHLRSEVSNAFLHTSFINGGQVLGATLNNCYVEGECVIRGQVSLTDCNFGGAVVIEGNVTLKNLFLRGKHRIGFGDWMQAPRYIEIDNSEIQVGITESTEGCAYIGCQRKPIEQWLKGSERFVKVAGWDKHSAEIVIETLREWLK